MKLHNNGMHLVTQDVKYSLLFEGIIYTSSIAPKATELRLQWFILGYLLKNSQYVFWGIGDYNCNILQVMALWVLWQFL